MKLSIIIPVYNVEKHISKCLDSLVNQDVNKTDYEVIIVNDGSKDKSASIAVSYCESQDNFFLYNQENQGVGAARNKGLSIAIGEYIYFLDPDDYLADNVLDELISIATKYKSDVLTFNTQNTTSKTLNSSNSNNVKLHDLVSESGLDYIANYKYKNEVWWYIINKNFIDSINLKFITGSWMEDAIFTVELFVKAKSIIKLPLDIHRHVRVSGSAMTNRESKHYLDVINANANAAVFYNSIIKELDSDLLKNKKTIKQLRSRQQSFVFFMMIRILKSSFKRQDILPLLHKMKSVNAYKLDSFLGKDYKGFKYYFLSNFFSNKYLYYILFIIANPLLKRMN